MILNDKFAQWIAVKTFSRHEKAVYDALKKKGIDLYLPIVRELHKWHDRKKWVDVPLITTYVFANIKKSQLYQVNNEKGVVKAVSFGDNVSIVSDNEIEYMRRLVDSKKELFVNSIKDLKKGARVRLLSPPFEGMEGYIIKDNPNGNFGVKIDSLSIMIYCEIEKELLQFIE